MSARTVDLSVELLNGGLGKLAAKCIINGSPKANPEGVALMVQVVTSLFAPPPGVATHILPELVVPAELPASGIPGGSTDPLKPDAVDDGDTAEGGGGEEEESKVESEASDGSGVQSLHPKAATTAPKMAPLWFLHRCRRQTLSWSKRSSWGRPLAPLRPFLGWR